MNESITYGGPLRFAHRGLAQIAPENTLGAFQGAIDSGCEGIEIDIQLSRDGEVIVAHDGNFTRMTLGHPTGASNRRIQDMTWEEIRKMELPYANHLLSRELPRHSDIEFMATLPYLVMGQVEDSDYETALARDGRMAHLMRFSDFDEWLTTQHSDVIVEIEIKAPGLSKPMLDLLSKSPNMQNYILFSGKPAYIEEMQSTFRREGKPAGLRLGANIRFLTEEMKQKIPEMDLYEVGLNAEAFTKADVQWLADRGIHVLSNLGDYPRWWETMITLDILGFKTNYAEAFTKWWSENHGINVKPPLSLKAESDKVK